MIERILKHMNIYREMKNAAIPMNLIGKKGEDFYRMFGFKEEGIDYEAETDPVVEIPSIKE